MNAEKRAGAARGGALKRAAAIAARFFAGALFILYPVFVYFALERGGTRQAALALLALYLPLGLIRFIWGRRAKLGALQLIPLIPLIAIGLASLLAESGLLLATPTLINFALLAVFGATLFTERPMIERFARLVDPELSDARRSWCALWTRIWCGFFAVNGALAGLLALHDDPIYWTAYTSIVSYVLMGLLFGGEMVLRYLRFGSLRESRS